MPSNATAAPIDTVISQLEALTIELGRTMEEAEGQIELLVPDDYLLTGDPEALDRRDARLGRLTATISHTLAGRVEAMTDRLNGYLATDL